MKRTLFLIAALSGAALFAAGKGGDPVSPEYVDWQGVADKNRISGRYLDPADLRHKVVIVLEIEPSDKLREQLVAAAPLAAMTGLADAGSGGWEGVTLPRDVLFVVNNRGDRKPDVIKAALKAPADASDDVKAALKVLSGPTVPVYDGITFEKAPESEGKRPYVYVMGPDGKEPVYEGAFDDSAVSAVASAVETQKRSILLWEPNTGSVREPKFFPQVKAAVAKGGPLKTLVTTLAKETQSKDVNRAREAQILHDALIQARDDLTLKIELEVTKAPHLAFAEAQRLVKAWPSQKKYLLGALAKASAIPGAAQLGAICMKVMPYLRSGYTPKSAGEAKKAVAELGNLRKQLAKLKESKVPAVQEGATALDSQLESLASSLAPAPAAK